MIEVGRPTDTVADRLLKDALRRLDGYRVERVLSEKPGFRTELACHEDGDDAIERVVLKSISRELANPELWSRYGNVATDHLPKLIDVMALPDEFVVVLQYVPGEPLDAYLERQGPLDSAKVRSIMDDLCDAASALAEMGIVHRDIKPSNVVLSFDGAYLIDPGIARVSDGLGKADDRGRDTTILGSWGYAAPEQLGFAETDARSDVFSLGRLLSFMLTGLSPNDPDFPRALRDGAKVPEGLRAIVTRACALEPSLRPANAQALKRQLDALSQPVLETSTQVWLESSRPTGPIATRNTEMETVPTQRQGLIPVVPGVERRVTRFGSKPLAIGLVIAFVAFFGTLFCVMGFLVDSPSLPRWGNILYGFAMGIFGNYLPGYEIVRALKSLGAYGDGPSKSRTVAKRILIWWAVCFGLLIIVMGIARATGWQEPGRSA